MWHELVAWLGTVISSKSLDVPLVELHVGVVLLVNIWAFTYLNWMVVVIVVISLEL